MKELKEIKFEELTTKQKLGMTMCALLHPDEKNNEFAYDLIRNHSLGAVWVNPEHADMFIPIVKEIADYPILILCDAGSGFGKYKIGAHNAIGIANSEELAYLFGKVTAIGAAEKGYNVVCNPILDMAFGNCECAMNTRCFGSDKEKVAKLAAAEIRGMHDGGVLSVCKHYPGHSSKEPNRDSHMAEETVKDTKEEIIDNSLYPYRYLLEHGLLDGIMTRHGRFTDIDPEYPATLSKKCINIIREMGFCGFAITDAMNMMGVVAKYGWDDSKGMAIEAGNDLALVWGDSKKSYEAIVTGYEKGIITDETLDENVKRVIASQNKVITNPKFTSLTEDDKINFERLNTDTVFEKCDDGVSPTISKDGKHLFVVLTEVDAEIDAEGKVTVDTMDKDWYSPSRIIKKIGETFPNSECHALRQFQTPHDNRILLEKNLEYDDVIFVTFVGSAAYLGEERFTSRTLSLMRALQVTNRISAVLHFGNPYPLEEVPHIPRVIVGTKSAKNINAAIEVLAGERTAKGVLTYDVKFK